MHSPFEENAPSPGSDDSPRLTLEAVEDNSAIAFKQAVSDLEQLRQTHRATLAELAELRRSLPSQTASDREQQLEADLELLRSKVIKEMGYTQENYWQQIVRLTDELHGLHHLRAHLERELDYRSTTKAAVRQIIKTALRKLKLFEFIYRRYEAFVPVYNLLFGDRWKPATIVAADAAAVAAAQPQATPQSIDMESDRVNAFVLARSLGIAIRSEADFERLDVLAGVTKVTKALCIAPVEPHLPLLCALVRQGAEVQCVGCTIAEEYYVRQYDIKATILSLSEWMTSVPDVCLADYQLICMNATADESSGGDTNRTLNLLQGHLSPDVQIILSHTTA